MNKGIGLSAIALASSLFFTSAGANELDGKFVFGTSLAVNGDYTRDTSLKFNAGYQFHPNYAVEIVYADFGERKDFDGLEITALDGISTAFIAKYPVGNFNWYGKLGVFKWSEKGEFRNPYETPSSITKIDNSGTDILYGIGMSYHFNSSIAFKTELVGGEVGHLGIGFDVYF